MDLNDIHFSAMQVAVFLGFAIPFLTALATKANATGTVKTVVAAVFAGLAAVLAAVTGLHGDVTLSQLLISFAIAGVSAGASRAWLTEDMVQWLARVSAKFGVGGK